MDTWQDLDAAASQDHSGNIWTFWTAAGYLALDGTILEFKRLSKHHAGESHNNDQRANKTHKVRETANEGDQEEKRG